MPSPDPQHTRRTLDICAAPNGYRLAYKWEADGVAMFEEIASFPTLEATVAAYKTAKGIEILLDPLPRSFL